MYDVILNNNLLVRCKISNKLLVMKHENVILLTVKVISSNVEIVFPM